MHRRRSGDRHMTSEMGIYKRMREKWGRRVSVCRCRNPNPMSKSQFQCPPSVQLDIDLRHEVALREARMTRSMIPTSGPSRTRTDTGRILSIAVRLFSYLTTCDYSPGNLYKRTCQSACSAHICNVRALCRMGSRIQDRDKGPEGRRRASQPVNGAAGAARGAARFVIRGETC